MLYRDEAKRVLSVVLKIQYDVHKKTRSWWYFWETEISDIKNNMRNQTNRRSCLENVLQNLKILKIRKLMGISEKALLQFFKISRKLREIYHFCEIVLIENTIIQNITVLTIPLSLKIKEIVGALIWIRLSTE